MDSPLRYRLIKFFYPLADEVVCVSQAIEKILNEDYGVKNTRTIYNMMEIEKNIELSTEELPGEYKELFEGDNFNFINMESPCATSVFRHSKVMNNCITLLDSFFKIFF